MKPELAQYDTNDTNGLTREHRKEIYTRLINDEDEEMKMNCMSNASNRRGLWWAAAATLTLSVAFSAGATTASAVTGSKAHTASKAHTSNASAAASQQDLAHPTKALCKQAHYKIGYDVFSDSQPFAHSLTQGLVNAAKSIGCAEVVKTVDNLNGPVAVGNLKTLLNQGIQGFVDFQVLAAYQPAMSKILKQAKIPAVTVVGATLPGFPQVGLAPFNTEKNAAVFMANVAKKRFPGMVPYFIGGAEPTSGPAVYARYLGAVAGIKKSFPGIPASHIIEVKTEGIATTAYNNTLSALSQVPSDALVLMQAVNDEDLGGMFKAAQNRHFSKFLVNSFGGDSYGLAQVCANPTHYVGAWYLDPEGWGPVLLSIIMNQMNHVKVPTVTNIAGFEVTRATPFLHCKK
jgi:ABC-type sugar transport system substrate-binding protein